MTEKTPGDVTQLLIDWRNGNKAALDSLLPLVYQILKRIAYGALNEWPGEKAAQALPPTALVHEAYNPPYLELTVKKQQIAENLRIIVTDEPIPGLELGNDAIALS